MSSNQIGGFFNRLEASRKYLFGSIGVLGEANSSVISGVFITRGDEIKLSVDCAPDWESYEYKKLDLTNGSDKKFFEDALAWDLELDGKKWADGKNVSPFEHVSLDASPAANDAIVSPVQVNRYYTGCRYVGRPCCRVLPLRRLLYFFPHLRGLSLRRKGKHKRMGGLISIVGNIAFFFCPPLPPFHASFRVLCVCPLTSLNPTQNQNERSISLATEVRCFPASLNSGTSKISSGWLTGTLRSKLILGRAWILRVSHWSRQRAPLSLLETFRDCHPSDLAGR